MKTNNSVSQLLETIDALKADGKQPKVTKLPSQANRNRKSLYGVKQAGSRRHSGKAQLQNTLYWTSY